jgi:hypothetical protein
MAIFREAGDIPLPASTWRVFVDKSGIRGRQQPEPEESAGPSTLAVIGLIVVFLGVLGALVYLAVAG